MFNIKLSLYKLIPVSLLALIRTVIANMTGNANFPTPKVSMANMNKMADALESAITAATNGDRQSRILRDNLVLESRDMLRTQADYVRSEYSNDRAKLESRLRARPAPRTSGEGGRTPEREGHYRPGRWGDRVPLGQRARRPLLRNVEGRAERKAGSSGALWVTPPATRICSAVWTAMNCMPSA
ncbi:MAG: hypothetical protein IPI55_16120 [Flavobacteriales bacterium]|nr:hypothetical protein [Flavobacteriales bacterium]